MSQSILSFSCFNSPKIVWLQFSVFRKVSSRQLSLTKNPFWIVEGIHPLKFNAMGVVRPPHNVTCYTQFPVKRWHDNMQNTWVTLRDHEIATVCLEEARQGIYLVDFTQVAWFSQLWGMLRGCTMHNANTVYVLLAGLRETQHGKGLQSRQRITAGAAKRIIARHILRKILALWCKCRRRSRRRVRKL